MLSYRRLSALALGLGLSFCGSGAVQANTIGNGDFATDLTGWSTLSTNGSVQWVGGAAVLTTGSGVDPFSAVLVQGDDGFFSFANPIDITAAAPIFKFDAVFEDIGLDSSETPLSSFTDSLSVWVYDAAGLNDQFLTQIDLSSLSGPAYSFDLASLVGLQVAFSFELADEADGRDSRVRLDNVRLEAAPATVPLPGGLLLMSSGALAYVFGGGRRRGRSGAQV